MEDVEMEDASAQLQAEAEGEDETVTQSTQERRRPAPLELPQYSKDELADMNKKTLLGEIAALEEKTQNVNVDLGVLAEYRRRVEEHAARSSDLASAISQRDAAKKRCDDLRRLRLEGFMEGFSTISLRLKEMYQMITMGGNAELELVDSLDPFSEGILFSVMPPKKSWKNIGNLSGGEKTLSSLALVFALHHYKPTPLYVMDEIDAALDFRNVSYQPFDAVIANPFIPSPHSTQPAINTDKYPCRYPSWPTTSKSAPRTRSSSSSRCATTCSSWPPA
jgi:structural maintenance of chromosome 4